MEAPGTHTLGGTATQPHVPKATISANEARRVFCMGFQQRRFIPRVEGPRTKDRTEDEGVGLYTGRRSG